MADALRAFLLSLIVANFLFTGTILVVYWKRALANETIKTNLTRHVVSILFGFLLLVGYVFIDVVSRMGTEGSWRIPYLIPTFLLCLISQFFMFNFQVKRWRQGE